MVVNLWTGEMANKCFFDYSINKPAYVANGKRVPCDQMAFTDDCFVAGFWLESTASECPERWGKWVSEIA